MSGDIGLHYAFRRLHTGENALAKHLLEIADRHRTDHEVHHVARDLADWSKTNVREIAEVAAAYDLDLGDTADDLYLMASENSLAWEMLAQHAQAKQERDVLALAERGHPQTLRQVRWANTMIKTLSPQVLSSM
jgi:hypothetical protein